MLHDCWWAVEADGIDVVRYSFEDGFGSGHGADAFQRWAMNQVQLKGLRLTGRLTSHSPRTDGGDPEELTAQFEQPTEAMRRLSLQPAILS